MDIIFHPSNSGLSITAEDDGMSVFCVAGIPDAVLVRLRDDLNERFHPRDNRFTEPSVRGLYISRSGRILFNDGDDENNWHSQDMSEPLVTCMSWHELLSTLGEYDFPLVRTTREMLADVAKAKLNDGELENDDDQN